MSPRGESLTSQRRLAAIDRGRQALELRKGGASFLAIAQALGYRSPQAAYEGVNSALRRTIQEPADEVRRLEIERLDGMLLVLQAGLRLGDVAIVDRALKIMERRARLLGLDAPATSTVDMTINAADELLGRLERGRLRAARK